ncbi:MAG TPA: ABC transporter permease [Terracidiphilus sp.]|jgi:predicted permease|nr:ABC transporter permease [Terracidiphilus sp.]
MFKQKRSREDFSAEVRAHLELEAAELKAEGLSEEEARRHARVEFGNVPAAEEQYAMRGRVRWLENVVRDIRYAVRGLGRNPGFTAVTVVTLALAIGANTTIFSLLDQAMLRALPVADPARLVVFSFAGAHPGHWHSEGGSTPGHVHEFSYPMYRDLREKNTVLSGLIATAPASVGVTWENRAESVGAEMVSGNYFETLGVRPALGRLFVDADETTGGANPVAVLNFDYWKTHLAEAPVVGRTLLINGSPFTVMGVAAPGFHSMVWGRQPAVYVPLTMQGVLDPDFSYLQERQSYWIELMGRLREGVTTAQATASMNQLFLALRKEEFTQLKDQSAKAHKDFLEAAHLNVDEGAKGFSPMRDDVRTPLTIVMGMALLVIAMAVVNVASLLLVRAATRVREFSVRYALGATGGQIVRQLLVEGLLLGLLGAVLGVVLAPRALSLLIHWMSGRSPDQPVFAPTLDWRVLAFALGATVAASLIFSLAPAAQFWNPRLAEALRQTGNGINSSMKFRRSCVALQIGFSLVLLIAAGLFVRTIENLRTVNAGFATERLLEFDLAPEMAGYGTTAVAPLEQRALDTLTTLPGVKSLGATNDPDLANDDRTGDVVVSGYTPKPDEEFDIELPWVSSGYLQTLGVPLVAGRYFAVSDTATATKVAIVNESFVRHYFANVNAALGQHVSRPKHSTDAIIVGVVRDVKHQNVREAPVPTCYIPFAQGDKPTGLRFYVRTWQAPDAAANSIRTAIANIDSKLIVSHLSTMTEEIDDSILQERTIALLASAFGVLAAVLAGIGLYGILAYSIAQRTREIGIRMALGARRGTVVSLIVREVLMLAGSAVLVTIPLAIAGSAAVRSQLFGVSIADPLIYGAGILVIGVVATLAGFIPAQRAASVNPTEALRGE